MHDIKYEFQHVSMFQMKNDISIFDDFNEIYYSDMHKYILEIINKNNYSHSIINIDENRKY